MALGLWGVGLLGLWAAWTLGYLGCLGIGLLGFLVSFDFLFADKGGHGQTQTDLDETRMNTDEPGQTWTDPYAYRP